MKQYKNFEAQRCTVDHTEDELSHQINEKTENTAVCLFVCLLNLPGTSSSSHPVCLVLGSTCASGH